MSKGYMGPGAYVLSWVEFLKFAVPLAFLCIVVFGGFIWWVFAHEAEIERKAAASYSQRSFDVGDIVQTRVGRLRGTIISIRCYDGCSYWVRFPVASMETKLVGELEIEPAGKK